MGNEYSYSANQLQCEKRGSNIDPGERLKQHDTCANTLNPIKNAEPKIFHLAIWTLKLNRVLTRATTPLICNFRLRQPTEDSYLVRLWPKTTISSSYVS
jgi:hypothetical protein